jgi:type VI secretion system secreted protein Hcp
MPDYFIKIGDIKGESKDKDHTDEIDVLSLSFGSQNPANVSGSGLSAGKVSYSDLNFMMMLNNSYVDLSRACAMGEHFDEVVLSCRKAGEGQQDFFIVTLTEVVVSSVQISGAGGSTDVPSVAVALTFAKMKIGYCPQLADGTLDSANEFEFNIQTNEST